MNPTFLSRGVAAIAGITLALVVALAATQTSSGANFGYGVFDRPAAARDQPPPSVFDGTVGGEIGDADSIRFVGDLGGIRHYIARGHDDYICLISEDHVAKTNGIACNPPAAVRDGFWAGALSAAGNRVVAVLAPDGYEDATLSGAEPLGRTALADNVVLFELDPSVDVRIRLEGADQEPIDFTLPPTVAAG